MNCPKCNEPCDRVEVDIGVGVECGPYGCPGCGWSEYERYDLSDGKSPVDARGGAIDQFGCYHPPGSSMALAYRLADTPCGWRDGTHIPLAAAGLRSTDPITVNVTTEGTITGPVAEVDMAASYTIEATLNGKTYQWTGQRPKPHGDGFIFRFKAT